MSSRLRSALPRLRFPSFDFGAGFLRDVSELRLEKPGVGFLVAPNGKATQFAPGFSGAGNLISAESNATASATFCSQFSFVTSFSAQAPLPQPTPPHSRCRRSQQAPPCPQNVLVSCARMHRLDCFSQESPETKA
jgi:hypothetical protein